MKYRNGIQLAAYATDGIAILAIKKGSLITTITDTDFQGDGGGFACDVAGSDTYVQFKKQGGSYHATVDLPKKGTNLTFKCKSIKKFEKFLKK